MEEQQEMLNKSDAYAGTILGLVKNPKMNLNDDCMSPELADTIAKDLLGHATNGKKKNKKHSKCDDYVEESIQNYSEITDTARTYANPDSYKSNECGDNTSKIGLRPISYRINHALNRVVLSDGISPTALSLNQIGFANITDEYLSMEKDADEVGSIISLLALYIISCKHPTAIINAIEFDKYFYNVESMDTGKFLIMCHSDNDDLFLLYYIDSKSEESFLNLIKENNYDYSEALKMIVSMAYAAGECHNIFLIDDESYVKDYINFTKGNAMKFISMVHDDEKTVMNPDADPDRDDNITRLDVIDLIELQADARNLLLEMADDDDDEEDVDSEDENDEKTEADVSDEDDEEDTNDEEPSITIGEDEAFDILEESLSESSSNDTKPEDKTKNVTTNTNMSNQQSSSGNIVMEKITR